MCDTLIWQHNGVTWLAKNSDREPDEPQALFFYDRITNDHTAPLRTTYLTIPQSPYRHALLLSQPAWLWGGEMGINEHGVCIANEALFSRLRSRRERGLLGMDLLRLGLERSATAGEALSVITTLLMQYGQGGSAGFRDHGFCYDNAFLIADRNEAWILETAARLWAAKRVKKAAISNCYSLQYEFDLCSPDLPGQAKKRGLWSGKGDFDFAKTMDSWLYPFVGGAHQRRQCNLDALAQHNAPSWSFWRQRLRDHGSIGDQFSRHNNRQVCMHAANLLRPSQTTASLIARVNHDAIHFAATATSAPCLSLLQPAKFGDSVGDLIAQPHDLIQQSCWARFEPVHQRALVDAEFRDALTSDRDRVENHLFAASEQTDVNWPPIAATATQWRQQWHERAQRPSSHRQNTSRWWRKKQQHLQHYQQQSFIAALTQAQAYAHTN